MWIAAPSSSGGSDPLLRRRYLRRAVPAIEAAARAMPGVRVTLLVVGGIAPATQGVRCIQRPWSERNEREALDVMDVGLMPLPENSWTRGKCAYKAIQYMASGVPVIAADVGVTRDVVGAGGVVANARADWVGRTGHVRAGRPAPCTGGGDRPGPRSAGLLRRAVGTHAGPAAVGRLGNVRDSRIRVWRGLGGGRGELGNAALPTEVQTARGPSE